MPSYSVLVPIDLNDSERGDAMIELGELYTDLRAAKDDVTVRVESTAEGDLFVFHWPLGELPIVDRRQPAA